MPNLVPIQIVHGMSYARQECSGSARRKCSVNVLWTLQHIFEGIADDTDHHE